MTSKLSTLSLLTVIILSGCAINSTDNDISTNTNVDIHQMLLEIQNEQNKKIASICSQQDIPAEYAKDCYFLDLQDCESESGKIIKRDDLKKCLPVFLKEMLEN